MAPTPRPMPTARTLKNLTRARTSEGSFVEFSNEGAFLASWYEVPAAAADAAARVLKGGVREVFERQGAVGGFPAWTPNDPKTVDWKGHDKVMKGRAHGEPSLWSEARDVRVEVGAGGAGRELRRVVLGSDRPHPDSHPVSGRPLTTAEMFILHEFGMPAKEGGWHIPPRPWLSRVFDAGGPYALGVAEYVIGERISRHMSVLNFPLRGGVGPMRPFREV